MYIYIYPIKSVPFNPMKSSIKWCLKSPIRRPKRAWKGRTPSEPKCSSGPRRLDHPDVFGDEKNLGKPWEIPCFDGGVDGKNQGKTMGNHGNIWENPLFLWKFDWEKTWGNPWRSAFNAGFWWRILQFTFGSRGCTSRVSAFSFKCFE